MENINSKNLNTHPAICARCVLPQSDPDIWLDGEGVCNICREHEKNVGLLKVPVFLETEFVKILNKNKSKGPYDCLVMCSGGKDSTAALYYMKKRYKQKPLAFTFDHGFETQEAMENVRNAVEILGVDHIIFKSDYMKEMFADIVKTGSKAVICHPCSIWYMQLTFDLAARYDIPVIIAGWTKGQASKQPLMSRCGCNVHQQEFISMGKATQVFLEEYVKTNPKYKNFPRSMEDVLAAAKKKHNSIVLSPHWFLPVDSDSYMDIIKNELKWKMPAQSYPAKTTNCALNFLSVHNSIKNFGYTHYHVEMSKMIRDGLLTREDALKLLKINYDQKLIDSIERKLRGNL